MTPYALAVLSLGLALIVQCLVACIAAWRALHRPYRLAALFLTLGFALLAMHDARNLELALHTGLFDLRQSLVSAGVSLFLLLGLRKLRHT